MSRASQLLFTLILLFFFMTARSPILPPPLQNHCVPSLTCWYDIVPGTTRFVDAVNVLKHYYAIDDLDVWSNSASWSNQDRDFHSSFLMQAQEDIVITMMVFFPQKQVTVSDLIEQLGEPSQVGMIQSFSPGTNCAGLMMVFPDRGAVAMVYPDGGSVGVRPAQSIQILEIMLPDTAKNYPEMVTDTFFLDWQGYIDYCPE